MQKFQTIYESVDSSQIEMMACRGPWTGDIVGVDSANSMRCLHHSSTFQSINLNYV